MTRVTPPRSAAAAREAARHVSSMIKVRDENERAHRRLTDVERAERDVSGTALQAQIADLAELLGWEWCHWRPLRNRRGIYQVPVEGPLGEGWPDLTLVRERDRRLIFAEVKRELEPLKPAQEHVLGVLRSLEQRTPDLSSAFGRIPRLEVHVWRPSDLRDPIESSRIYEVLR